MSQSIESITQVLNAKRIGHSDYTIYWLLTDSRSLSFPETTLFFALRTKRNNGHNYIMNLYERGVRNFVVDEWHEEFANCKECNFLEVTDVLHALQLLASVHRAQFQVPVIGITGSNGKTMVKEWLYQLLGSQKVITRSPRSYNSQIGVPLSVWTIDDKTELGIFEAGISEPEEMDALQQIIQPTIGVLTNIGSAHQENFPTLRAKCMEKLKLFADCDTLIYNADNPLISDCVNRVVSKAREIAWSRVDADRPLFIRSVEKHPSSTTVRYRYLNMPGEYVLPFIDDASIENSFHCLAVALLLMVPPQVIAGRMSQLQSVAMRLEVKEGKNGCVVINDSYNADMYSLDIALSFMQRRTEDVTRRRVLILSDMYETGQGARTLFKQVAELCKIHGVHRIIGVGEQISAHASRFDMERSFYPTTEDLLESDELDELRDCVVLVKGARKFGFDKVSDRLELKVHETILEVNLDALVANLNHYRGYLDAGTKIACMVKASAYGAGALEVAKTLQDHRVDYLAVAVADEGCELRKAGITCDIMVMNPELTSFTTLFNQHLEPEVYGFGLLDALVHAAEREGITNFPIHVKLDTGMHRLGFAPNEVDRLVERLQGQSALIVRSVFSHFVGSDSDQFDDFTRRQLDLFNSASEKIQSACSHKILRHICNTAGIERMPGAHFDMVRLGLGLYGINPYTNGVLHNVSTLRTVILQVREVPAGDTVGYGRRGQVNRVSRIATLPIGYADGLNRRLGNGAAYCLVNGQRAYYVGNICMDACMVDVTDIECVEGDGVEIFGENLPVTTLSDVLGTIPYEILTGVSTRVKRIYFSE